MVLTACDTRKFDRCPPDQVFGEWGVMNDSYLFGKTDSSAYYLVNPIGEVFDSLYYNADYTDSYFQSDSTRITVVYQLNDSVKLYFDRLYYVQTNPSEIYLLVTELDDTVKTDVKQFCFTKSGNSDHLYSMKGTEDFRKLMMTGKPLSVLATNFPETYQENANAQVYTFLLYTSGFEDALKKCCEMNHVPVPETKPEKKEEKKKTVGPRETLQEKEKINRLENEISLEKKKYL